MRRLFLLRLALNSGWCLERDLDLSSLKLDTRILTAVPRSLKSADFIHLQKTSLTVVHIARLIARILQQ